MYSELLKKSAESAKNIVCMGLDPVIAQLPNEIRSMGAAGIPVFFEILFKEMQHRKLSPAAFKPNQGYYFILDEPLNDNFDGSRALAKTIQLAKIYFPDTPIIMDFKRGDIATSSKNYAIEGFERWQCDAATISPYMGNDSVSPFLKYGHDGKGTYILNRTSNPGSIDFQSKKMAEGNTLFEQVANRIIEWNKEYPGTGAVVGATSPDELAIVAAKYAADGIPLLIPGVGSQGGSAQDVMNVLNEAHYPSHQARINSSSGLTHPWAKKKDGIPENWVDVSVNELEKLVKATKI